MRENALTFALIVIALVVTGAWLFIVITDAERAPAVTVVLTSIFTGLIGLLGKVRHAERVDTPP